jgi:hypothetical protein
MSLRMKRRQNGERIDQVQQNLLNTVKVSEEEINAVAGSPNLYDGLRVKIAAGRAHDRAQLPDKRTATRLERQPGRLNLSPAFWMRSPLRWTLTAAAILLLGALAMLLLLPRQSSPSTEIAPALPLLVPSPPGGAQPPESPTGGGSETAQIGNDDPAPASAFGPSRRHHRRNRNSGSTEVATDFFPLTYTADSTAPESGHIVRVKIARTALIAVGLPMNAARAGELITADVVIGDDGLARAIRFIQ